MECPVVSFEMGLWVWWDFGQHVYGCSGLCSWLLENLHGMSCSGTYWLLGVGMEALDDLLLINVPCSQEFSGVLRFWA